MSLPPLRQLSTHSTIQIKQAFQNLRNLYFAPNASPAIFKSSNLSIPKRSIKHFIHDTSVPDSGYASAEEDDEDEVTTTDTADTDTDTDTEQHVLRADPLERAFAIKWMTGFITRADDWIAASETEEEAEERSEFLDDATALLSSFTGTNDDQDFGLTRIFTFPLGRSAEGPQDSSRKLIHVELHDAPLSSVDHTSVGLQSWGCSILLADRFCLEPSTFSLIPPSQGRSLRILELGAGTGMLSIVAAKVLHPFTAEIVATDYHPDVLENLAKNVATNFPTSSTSSAGHQAIAVAALDWEQPKYSAPLDQPFDIILAADVIYHPSHAEWIKPCIENLLSRRSNVEDKGGVFWLMITVRNSGRHEGTHETVEALFPNMASCITSLAGSGPKPQLAVLHREVVERRASIGRADESAYILFKIGWLN